MDFFINFSDQGLLGLKLKQSSWNVCRFQKRTFETNPNAKHWGLKCNIKSLCVTISNFSSKITREVSKCKIKNLSCKLKITKFVTMSTNVINVQFYNDLLPQSKQPHLPRIWIRDSPNTTSFTKKRHANTWIDISFGSRLLILTNSIFFCLDAKTPRKSDK